MRVGSKSPTSGGAHPVRRRLSPLVSRAAHPLREASPPPQVGNHLVDWRTTTCTSWESRGLLANVDPQLRNIGLGRVRPRRGVALACARAPRRRRHQRLVSVDASNMKSKMILLLQHQQSHPRGPVHAGRPSRRSLRKMQAALGPARPRIPANPAHRRLEVRLCSSAFTIQPLPGATGSPRRALSPPAVHDASAAVARPGARTEAACSPPPQPLAATAMC